MDYQGLVQRQLTTPFINVNFIPCEKQAGVRKLILLATMSCSMEGFICSRYRLESEKLIRWDHFPGSFWWRDKREDSVIRMIKTASCLQA
jgi:hypothetical protein